MSSGARNPALEGPFPGLASSEYAETSLATRRYNCIAWAAGDEHRWWWPEPFPHAYWPEGTPRVATLESFIAAYATLGFERSADGGYQPGIEKVALFADDRGVPTHAARQLSDGRWTSKLGRSEDIRHELKALEGDVYGKVACFLERPW